MNIAAIYQIKIKGHLDLRWSDWFDGLVISHLPGGVTLLTGPVVDQAALFGLLLKIRDLNLTLLSLKRLESDHDVCAYSQR
ncbi:MAG: hypothetical protein FOGNACKC_04321 [Anaerolineae bacterium]|nr:hypothetical protein [Anaerolineae bacterium]